MKLFATLVCLVIVGIASPALAVQTHGEPEGLVVHQISHLFFIISMATLAYWLRERRLTASGGWRFIRYAALLLILWNFDAMIAHLLDEQTQVVRIITVDPGRIRIVTSNGNEMLGFLYYLVKLDHLFCVPALVFLYLGLRRLASETGATETPTP